MNRWWILPMKNQQENSRPAFLTSIPAPEPRIIQDEKIQLPAGFTPSAYSVLLGRGKRASDAIGTRRLKIIASRYLDEYSTAPSRIEKSVVVTKIIDIVRDACPVGAFLKFEDGHWWEVSDSAARERVGGVLRDVLHDQYKSSNKSRTRRRKQKRNEGEQESEEEEQSSPSSSQHHRASPRP